MVSPSSLASVEAKWVPELQQHGEGRPIILVGTKLDLAAGKAGEEAGERVSSAEAEAVARRVKAVAYVECSALTQQGLTEVFEAAVKAARAAPLHKRACCAIL